MIQTKYIIILTLYFTFVRSNCGISLAKSYFSGVAKTSAKKSSPMKTCFNFMGSKETALLGSLKYLWFQSCDNIRQSPITASNTEASDLSHIIRGGSYQTKLIPLFLHTKTASLSSPASTRNVVYLSVSADRAATLMLCVCIWVSVCVGGRGGAYVGVWGSEHTARMQRKLKLYFLSRLCSQTKFCAVEEWEAKWCTDTHKPTIKVVLCVKKSCFFP